MFKFKTIMMTIKKLIFTGAVLVITTSIALAGSCKLHYTLKSGSKGVQGGYSSREACMKAGNGNASFADQIESFYCKCS